MKALRFLLTLPVTLPLIGLAAACAPWPRLNLRLRAWALRISGLGIAP